MKKTVFITLWYFFTAQLALADWWIFWDFKSSSWETDEALRNWDIHLDDIPLIMKWAIDFLMWIAWTIAIIFVIVWAYKILFGSLEQDKTKWKDTIIMALGWFAIASLAWFIIKLIIDNLS
jgi:uncharacterized membrane protein (DUF373 family)